MPDFINAKRKNLTGGEIFQKKITRQRIYWLIAAVVAFGLMNVLFYSLTKI